MLLYITGLNHRRLIMQTACRNHLQINYEGGHKWVGHCSSTLLNYAKKSGGKIENKEMAITIAST